jgi:hypothetical protein
MLATMIGPRLTSVFKSRWSALLWAGMVLWSAVEFVGFGAHDKDGAAVDDAQQLSNEDVAALKGVLEGK